MHLEVMEKGEFSIGVQLENVSKKFKGRKYAVCNLSLDIYRDQITVLLGHNGAGKSTTIGLITGKLSKRCSIYRLFQIQSTYQPVLITVLTVLIFLKKKSKSIFQEHISRIIIIC